MYEKLKACPLCDNHSFSNNLVVKDHAISGESFVLVACTDCGFLFTNPRPAQSQIAKYYQSENYQSHAASAKGLIDWVYQLARYFTIRQKFRWLNSLKPDQGKLLDYGCGTGSFLKLTARNGWDAWGVEPSHKAATIAKRKGLKISETLDDLSQNKFDIITLWHVLEHIPDIIETVAHLRKILKSDGYLVIAVPNYRSHDAEHYKQYWAGYDVPRHLYHFEQKTMKNLTKKMNLHQVKIIPLKLDAYYVSLLSEKYQKGSIFKAIGQGFRSNQWAQKNGQNYSSLVYVLRK